MYPKRGVQFKFSYQYCEYGPDVEKCRSWLEEHHPDEFSDLYVEKVTEDVGGLLVSEDTGTKKKQTRGAHV